MRQIKGGTLNVSIVIRIINSTDGTPETSVTSATGGLAFNYRREGAVAVAITAINDLALLTTAHTDGGILHIGDGYYRVDFQDAAFAAGATGVLLTGTATGMVVIGEYVELVAYDSADTVRLGLTALPNAVPGATGGAFIAGTNAATTVTTSFTTTFTGNLTGSVGSVTGAVGSVTGAVGSVTGAVGSVAGNVDGSVASVTAGVTLANGAITDASLAGNMEIVFETDFATNYNTTRNAWATNVQDFVGTTAADPFSGQVVAASVTNIPVDGSLTVTLAGGVTHGDSTAMLRLGSSGATPAFYVTNSSATLGHNAVCFLGGFGQVTGGDGLNLGGGGSTTLNDPGVGFSASEGAFNAQLVSARLTSIDTIEVDTTTDIPALIATAQTDLDTITGADGVNLLSATQASIDAIPTLAEILAGGDIDGYTLEETLKLCLAALAGKLSGAATTTVTIRAADDSKDRIVATVDSDGNRTAFATLDASG